MPTPQSGQTHSNCRRISVFDNFVGLALKGLMIKTIISFLGFMIEINLQFETTSLCIRRKKIKVNRNHWNSIILCCLFSIYTRVQISLSCSNSPTDFQLMCWVSLIGKYIMWITHFYGLDIGFLVSGFDKPKLVIRQI